MLLHDLKHPVAAGALLTTLALSTTATAQPNPFDDYERGAPAIPVDDPADQSAPALPPPDQDTAESASSDTGAAAAEPAYVSEQWRWSLGLGTTFSYTGTTNEVSDGTDRSNQTLFLTLAPRGGLFVIDRLEVSLSLGLLSKLTEREGNSKAAENNFFFETGAHYHIPVGNSGFALIPGFGLGGYFGGSSREFTIDGESLDESTSTAGFLINGYLGAAYQPSPDWRLRSGLSIGALFGSESIESSDQSLSASAVHIGLPISLAYVF